MQFFGSRAQVPLLLAVELLQAATHSWIRVDASIFQNASLTFLLAQMEGTLAQ